MEPVSCHLTQFHAFFVYPNNITIVSLITQQAIYSYNFNYPLTLQRINFDVEKQCLVLSTFRTPILVAKLLDDGVDTWK